MNLVFFFFRSFECFCLGQLGFLFFFGVFFFCFVLSGWRWGGLYRRVERHSLCPAFTSLEFKWPTGRLRLPFTSHHLHFPLHTVLSQLLTHPPHPSTLHTLPDSHTYSTNSYPHAFFPRTFNTNKNILYYINHSQSFTSTDVHMV